MTTTVKDNVKYRNRNKINISLVKKNREQMNLVKYDK